MIKLKYTFIFIFLFGGLMTAIAQSSISVKSPNEQLEVVFNLNDGTPTYRVLLAGEQFLQDSPLGLSTSVGDFTSGLTVLDHTIKKVSKSYDMTNAKVSHVDYEANELDVTLLNEQEDTLHIYLRVANRDVAYSYQVATPKHKHIKILSEASGFDLPDDATTYISPQALPATGWETTKPSYEEDYTLGAALGTPSTIGVGYVFPALFKIADRGWVLISETGVRSTYVGSRLSEGSKEGLFTIEFPQKGENNHIGDNFPSMAMPAKTPWRTITFGETLKPIIESTVAFDLVDPLYEPSQAYQMGRSTWSWIVWQDGSINYEDQKKFIDLSAALDFEYVLIDNWWDQRIGRDRMVELVNYAAAKNVSIILWYNSNGWWNNAPQTPQDIMNTAPERQKEMAWLQSLGVKGIKVDFFGGDKQETMKLYEDILTEANRYGIAVNFHGCTLPRGWQRMFPNYVSSEAVLASENLVFQQSFTDNYARTATIMPFTRNAVGAMDFGPVFLNKRLSKDQKGGSIRRTTEAFELATAVLLFSPVQHFGLTPNNLDEQHDFVLDYLRKVPTVWDETVYIGGQPEDYCAIARRNGDNWYVAVVNGIREKRTIKLDLPMLAGKELQLLSDEKDRSVGNNLKQVKKDGTISVDVLGEGGAVLVFGE